MLDKGRIGGGASGAAGGIVRNFYRSEAITDLIRLSIEIFEDEPDAYGFRQVGYVAAVPQRQADDLVAIRSQHQRFGYESELIVGAEDCREYLAWNWPDWRAPVDALLHERRGGWADSAQTARHLAERARAAGAAIHEWVEVTDVEYGPRGVEAIATASGRVECDVVVAAPGPWISRVWRMLGREPELDVSSNGGVARRPLVAYWKAQEGEFALPGVALGPRAGSEPPVVHLDQDRPLSSDRDGRELAPGPWGIYFRFGRTGTGVTGGGLPVRLSDPQLDPYGPGNPAHAAEPEFSEFFVSGLAAAFERFRGHAGEWRMTLGGGVVAHTPDHYPVCDWVAPNAYAIVDSGHGFKMLALGQLAADDILEGESRLDPFRLDRFERGATHVASRSPYPWT